MSEEGKCKREQNLKPFTKNQNKEAASRAGKKSAALRKAKKKLDKDTREIAKYVLSCVPELTGKELSNMVRLGLWDEDMGYNARMVAIARIMKNVLEKGDYKAFESIVGMAGELYDKPDDSKVKDDGFLAALGSTAGAIFEEGGDVPDGMGDNE